MHPYHHAQSSAEVFNSTPEEHYAIHALLDSSKRIIADPRHRSLLHHKAGIEIAILAFPELPHAREIATLHIEEDLGKVPPLSEWMTQPSDFLRKSIQQNPLARETNLKKVLDNNPFCQNEQAGLQQIVDILTLPEKLEPNLATSPLRMFYYNAAGIFLCQDCLGTHVPGAKKTPTRYAAEWIVKKTLQSIPSFQDIQTGIEIQDWMYKNAMRKY